MSEKQRILIVDDEEFNLKILAGDLEDNGYEVVQAQNGKIACDILQADDNFQVVLLDRMMPVMDGMAVLNYMKADPQLKRIPVIMQTAASATKQVLEGIEAGVFYYLTKPYDAKVMLAIVKSALQERLIPQALQQDIGKYSGQAMRLMTRGEFYFRTLEEATALAHTIAGGCPVPDTALVGLRELITNAVEHGNLGITFEEKTELLLANQWQEEVAKRLNHPSFRDKEAALFWERKPDCIQISIEDQGKGFQWEPYLNFYDPARATLPNGRGIAMAKLMSFDTVEYQGAGNKVICRILLKGRPRN